MLLRYLLLAVAVLSLVACQSKDSKKLELKAADLIKFEETVKVKKQWSRAAGSGQEKRFSRFVPALDGEGGIYTVGYKGDVQAFDATTGKKRWKVKTKAEISGGVAASASGIYFGTYDGMVHVLNKDTGELNWKAKVSSEVASAPAGNSDIVVAVTIDGRVFAFEAETGALRWSYDHTLPVLTLRGTASPVLTPTQVIVAFDNGQVLSLGAKDGSSQWQLRVSRPQGRTELDRIVDIDGTPVLNGSYLYAGNYQGNVVAASRGAGRLVWSKEASTHNAVVVANNKVFVSTDESRIVAYNALNGELEWENFQLKRRNTSAPAIFGDYLAVADGYGYVHVLNQDDGQFADRFKLAGGGKMRRAAIRAPLLGDGDTLYTYSNKGKLSAYTIVGESK